MIEDLLKLAAGTLLVVMLGYLALPGLCGVYQHLGRWFKD